MPSRIFTRCTTIFVFFFTCTLTANVVANERELAPLLTPDAWKLLLDAEAVVEGFTPAIVTSSELKPRTKIPTKRLIKLPNSRVKVKFIDSLQIRLDVHNKPYSRTERSIHSITELCDTLDITLTPTISASHANVDALIRRAELRSRKQQPDIGGIYWVDGDSMNVDVAAELFSVMDDVEWVIYKPVFSKLPKIEKVQKIPAPTQTRQPIRSQIIIEEVYGACHFTRQQCEPDISQISCLDQGGIFLGIGSICAPQPKQDSLLAWQDQEDQQQSSDGGDRGGDATGACCLAAGVCSALTAANCTAQLGVYQGDGTTCVVNPCSGACCTAGVCTTIISPQTPSINCTAAGGSYQGDSTTCAAIVCPDGNGECCLLSGCIAVADDAQCFGVNGIFLGVNDDDPPEPCGESQTECPAGVGPPFDAFNLCGENGDYVTYLTGDCYLDQTTVIQTSRSTVTIGCLDTELFLLSDPTQAQFSPVLIGGAGGNTDYIVASDAPNEITTNVFDSACCETISTDVPMCATNAWGVVCASYAHAYAVNGNVCLREAGLFPQSPTLAGQAFGPTQAPSDVQPRFNMQNIGSGISVFRTNAGGITNAMVEIVPPDPLVANSIMLRMYEDPGGLITTIVLTAPTTLDALETAIEGTPNWTATVIGTSGATTTVDTLATFPLTSCFQVALTQSMYATPIISGFLSPLGMPQIARTAITPDFANMGLLSWMSPTSIPFVPGRFGLTDPGQPNPMPTGATTPWDPAVDGDNYTFLYQLLPWPMGGAMVGPTTVAAPCVFPNENPNENALIGGIGWAGDGGVDLFPNVDNPDGFGGQEIYLGAYGYGQFWEDEQEVGTNGAFGANVQVAVLDWSAHLQKPTNEAGINLGGIHEEFLAADNVTLRVLLEGTATGHTPLTLIFDENHEDQQLPFGYSADHGTAVLGVIGARWNPAGVGDGSITDRMENNVGCLGIAPDATLYFFPLATVTSPDREEQAWYNAIDTMNAGDVICAAYRPVAVSAAQPNLNYWEDTAAYLEIANNLGIVTVIRAGDLGIDLASLDLPYGDQNVFTATAISPGSPFKRYADGTRGSNYSAGTVQEYSAATASGWGAGVTTCGKGPLRDNYLGYNTIVYSDPTDAHIVHAQAYTNNFGFTGAAAAQVAGGVALIQGFTKQVFSIPMGTEICRQLTAGGKYEGRDRDGLPVLTPAPQITTEVLRTSTCETILMSVDWDFCPDVTGNLTGNRLDPRGSMINVILNPIFDTPNIDNTMFIRGTLLMGNRYSISTVDGNLLAATPVKTKAHIPYPVPAGVPGGPVRYRGNGLTTDLYISGELQSNVPINNSLSVDITFFDVQQSTLFVQIYMLDNRTGRWRQAAATTSMTQGDTNISVAIERASAFINPSNNEYHLRIITLDVNTPNQGPTALYPVFYDQVIIRSDLSPHH